MSVHYKISNGTALVTFNNPPLNVFGQAMREGLNTALDLAQADGAERIILTGAGRSFVAGSDAKEFDGTPLSPHLNDILTRITTLPIPCIAAINGTALGGGLEIALACCYRIATPQAILGLPEVTLGIVPGAGGTQRLPRIIGIKAALDMIISGSRIISKEAQKLGLVDMIADDPVAKARELDATVLRNAISTDDRPAPTTDMDAIDKAHTRANKRTSGQNAPHAAIGLVDLTTEKSLSEGLKKERETFLELRVSDQARALRHVFFSERAALSRSKEFPSTKERVDTAIVVGGGMMGSAISYALATVGIAITLVEINNSTRERAEKNIQELVKKGVTRGLLSNEDAQMILKRVNFVVGYDNLPKADLAIEAAFESMDVKHEILGKLQNALPDNTILATNTSYLDVNKLSENIHNPGRFLGLHFFAPAHIMKLLEIVRHDSTSNATLGAVLKLSRQLNKIPVLSGVCDGFIGNRILKRYRQTADILLLEGSTPQEIDAAMRDFGMAMGPYESQDMSGLDIAYANRKRDVLKKKTDIQYLLIADHLVENLNRLGRKTNAGWYDYDDKGKATPSSIVSQCLIDASKNAGIQRKAISREAISNQLVLAMYAEGLDILHEGIAAKPSDIDLVTIHGYGFPRWRGGLMYHAKDLATPS